MSQKIHLSMDDVHHDVSMCLESRSKMTDFSKYKKLYPIPRGGYIVALILSKRLFDCQVIYDFKKCNPIDTLIVDDLIDSGKTRNQFEKYDFFAPYNKGTILDGIWKGLTLTYKDYTNRWMIFPWEQKENDTDESITDNITRIIQYIGDNPNREGLLNTPNRVAKSWNELFSGYCKESKDVITDFNSNGYDEIILCKDIEFYSTCEHHMLPFTGTAHIAYIPGEKIIGASKMPRLLEIYARRLQIQENLCTQVADSLMNEIGAKAAACIIEAKHLCMSCRGVNKQHSSLVTSCMRGLFLERPSARVELMQLIEM